MLPFHAFLSTTRSALIALVVLTILSSGLIFHSSWSGEQLFRSGNQTHRQAPFGGSVSKTEKTIHGEMMNKTDIFSFSRHHDDILSREHALFSSKLLNVLP